MFKHTPLEVFELESTEVNGKRFYKVEEDLFPSVTTVLSSFEKEGIKQWEQRVGQTEANKIKNYSSRRGTQLHLMCEDYVMNQEQYKVGRMPSTIELFKQIQPYLDNYMESVYNIEIPLHSKELKAAGRCDLLCRMHRVNCIVDYKTSTKPKKEEWIENYFLQTTEYAMMVEEMYDLPIFYNIVLIAVEEGGPQVFIKKPSMYKDKVINLFHSYNHMQKLD